MTIRELFQEFVIAKRKSRSEFNKAVTQTWLGARLPYQKTPKPLSAYLLTGQAREQGPASMMSSLQAVAGGFGGKLRPVTH